ncbi:MAG: UDP-N-acetylmuramoyl-L-alanyl-D-glutamate--2,6-diaminopimelate ligase [Bryobacterales bacterium]|nr:UDP-N-acetylmuramoyl-L-alanyl-D-glutamate--2,6-diaminopimelate ligase [Bryobacteraceae bacterium]MDW8356030.1 UDP-N-acetylmuramoyl-L-alanyl-D-glutamate--2,6-diaminopimelate ligase [Bryobacterales bacterium]
MNRSPAVTTLSQLLHGAPVRGEIPPELGAARVTGLDYDSRRIQPGFVFFAFPGSRHDGRRFAREALERGAVAVVSPLPALAGLERVWIEVAHGRQALALAARNFYGAPDERLLLTGVTGTNGKTTTCYLIDAVLRAAGKVTALIGTIEYRLADQVRPAVNTTPESLDIFRLLAELEQRGGTHVTMEVSSHALALERVYGLRFHTAVFTNLTRDHLDFHGTMEAYFAAKLRLFEGAGGPPPKVAVVNGDDAWGRRIPDFVGSRRLWYGSSSGADVRAEHIVATPEGLRLEVCYEGERIALRSALTGRPNAYNILAACGAAFSYGLPAEAIARGIEQCRAIPGRFERVEAGQPFLVIVDYAHTDDALSNLIGMARELVRGRIITVFGCGGDRDRTKRPLMGSVAGELSDFVVLTSDNPRSEDPLAILREARAGLERHRTPFIEEPDRARAIRRAIEEARPGDAVLIAGKGHETYQVLADRVIPFDDREVARAVLRDLGYGRGAA